jgi:gas vesicle protein
MSKLKEKNTQTPQVDSVDQIRNILFGEQVKIFENRFTQLENSLTNTIKELSNRVDSAIKDLNDQIEKSSNQSQSNTTDLAKQHEKDIQSLESSLKNQIIETESDLINQIQSGLEKLNSKASHRNELAELLKEMANKLAD